MHETTTEGQRIQIFWYYLQWNPSGNKILVVDNIYSHKNTVYSKEFERTTENVLNTSECVRMETSIESE